MGYSYSDERNNLFSDEGQRLFLSIRDRTLGLINSAGAVRLQEAIQKQNGSSWTMIAAMDRMVELGEIIEIKQQDVAGQHRVFVKKGGA